MLVSTGILRKRFPVAAKIALPMAGTIADVPGSPMPPGRFATLDDMDVDRRGLVHAQKLVGVKIRLFDTAILER